MHFVDIMTSELKCVVLTLLYTHLSSDIIIRSGPKPIELLQLDWAILSRSGYIDMTRSGCESSKSVHMKLNGLASERLIHVYLSSIIMIS